MHTKYYNKDNKEVPSVTTILKIINKPALLYWANYLGFRRQKVDDALSKSAHMGTTVHFLIEAILMKTSPVLDLNNIDREALKRRMQSFREWRNDNKIEPIKCELSLTSDLFGGTLDFYGKINDKLTLLDFKTSKAIYPTMFIQLCGYILLLEENGYKIEQAGILLVKEDRYEYKFIPRESLEFHIEIFKNILTLYYSYEKIGGVK